MRLVALDWVNFLLADVRGGLGAYVNVYLLTSAHWSQATIGAVLTVSGLTGIMLHPSVGAWIDKTRGKRALLIAGTVVLSVCGLAVVWAPTIPVVLASDIIMAVLGGVFAPVVAAMTVGLFDRDVPCARRLAGLISFTQGLSVPAAKPPTRTRSFSRSANTKTH